MRALILALVGLFAVVNAPAANAQSPATFMEEFKDWSTFKAETGGSLLCFAVSEPTDSEPKGVQRGNVYFYVSSWPKDGVAGEVSLKIGYDFATDATTVVTIGSQTFELFNNSDKAFVESPAQERELVQAMRRGNRMTVKGRSARGTETTDTFSLSGITAALRHVERNCS